MKFSISYILVIIGVLALLNTYPLVVSQDLVFRTKAATIQSGVSVLVSSVAELEELTPENVSMAISAAAAESGLNRVLVTDAAGKVLYDTRETNNAAGQYAFYAEIVQALLGYDSFHCSFENSAFRSRCAIPVLYQNRIVGSVFAYEYDTEQAALLRDLQRNLQLISALAAVAAAALALTMSRIMTDKIRKLLSAIRRVRSGAYGYRAEVGGGDEIDEIGVEFNSLTDRLERTEETRRRFVSDASHELKTPLAAIRLLSDSILQTENMDPETTREFVEDIGREAERLSRITEDLLRLTRLDSDALQPAEVTEVLPVLLQALRMMDLLAEERGIGITYEAEDGCCVLSARDEVQQVIFNLLDNAVKYTGDHGHVEVELRREADEVVLCVRDDGVGIPEEDLPRVFERFYRVDKARSREAGGTGLGLAIVSDTVRRRGGSVTAENGESGGAVFTVRWPAAAEGGADA